MKTNRRTFLKQAAAYGVGTALVSALRPFGGTAFADMCGTNKKTLVHIWLNGGPASHLLLAPSLSSSAFSSYSQNNPTIGVGVGSNPLGLGITSNSSYVLHPALTGIRDGMNTSLFGFRASIVNYVGYPNQNYSHEESSSIIKFGARSYSSQNTGWAGRLADQFCAGKDFSLYSFAGRSGVLRANNQEPLYLDTLNSFQYNGADWDGQSAFAREILKNIRVGSDLNISDSSMKKALTSMDTSVEIMRSLRTAYEGLLSTQKASYPNSALTGVTQDPNSMHWFARRMRDIAILIRSPRPPQFVTVELGGWDTHSESSNGVANLGAVLNGSLRAFCEDLSMGSVADKTVILAHGEFGRNGFENASSGNDHGHGGIMLVLDSGARPGIIGPSEYNPIDFMKRGVSGSRGEIPGGYGYRRADNSLVSGVDYREVLEQVVQRAGFSTDQIFAESFQRSGIQLFV